MRGEPRRNERTYRLAVAITIGLCAVWGVAHGVTARITGPFYRFLELSTMQHLLVTVSNSITYILVAIPAALFLRKLGYKLRAENRSITKAEAYVQLGHSASLFKAVLEHYK